MALSSDSPRETPVPRGTWNYGHSLGPCRKKRQVFNEALPVKRILNKQALHMAASPTDVSKIYTAVIDSPLLKLRFIIFKVDSGEENHTD